MGPIGPTGMKGMTGPTGPVGPTWPDGQDVDPALLKALLREIACHRTIQALSNGGALDLRWRGQDTIVRLNLQRATHLGIDLAFAIGCAELVFPEYEVVLKDGKSGSKSGSKSKSKS